MLLVVGLEDCSSCVETKEILERYEVDFDYKLSKELPRGDWKKYRFAALKRGLDTMPILVLNDKIVTLDEFMKEVG